MTVYVCQKCGRKVVSNSQNPRCPPPCNSSKFVSDTPDTIQEPVIERQPKKSFSERLDDMMEKHFETMRKIQICNALAAGVVVPTQPNTNGNPEIVKMFMEQNKELSKAILEKSQQEMEMEREDENQDAERMMLDAVMQGLQKKEFSEDDIIAYAQKNPELVEKVIGALTKKKK